MQGSIRKLRLPALGWTSLITNKKIKELLNKVQNNR